MDPTLAVGDVLLVEKFRSKTGVAPKRGEIVLFSPPASLQSLVKSNGGRISDRDLFVKSVVAVGGDSVEVGGSGSVTVNGGRATGPPRDLCEAEPLGLIQKMVKSGESEVSEGDVFVLGDCSDVSVDSRVWVRGTVCRIFPPLG